jgi:hypothetical protein
VRSRLLRLEFCVFGVMAELIRGLHGADTHFEHAGPIDPALFSQHQ